MNTSLLKISAYIIFVLIIVSCKNDILPIKCASEYLIDNTEQREVDKFVQLEGIDIWRKWDDFTEHIAEDRNIIEKCGINKYIFSKKTSLDSLKGQMIFVYSVHSYLQNKYVDEKEVAKKVEHLLTMD